MLTSEYFKCHTFNLYVNIYDVANTLGLHIISAIIVHTFNYFGTRAKAVKCQQFTLEITFTDIDDFWAEMIMQ